MPSRKRISLVLLVCAAAVVGALIWPRTKEPLYKGKTLKQWMNTYNAPYNPTVYGLFPRRSRRLLPERFYENGYCVGDKEADEMARRKAEASGVIRHIGTNAIPTFLEWEDTDARVAWKYKLLATLPESLRENHFINWWLVAADHYRVARALLGFPLLGSNAVAAIPELTRRMMTRSSDSGVCAGFALANMGAVALPALLGAATKTQTPNRLLGARDVGSATTAASNDISGIRVLAQCARDTDLGFATEAVMALRFLTNHPGITVLALTVGLNEPRGQVRARSAEALSHYGSEAQPAVPELLKYRNDPDPFVRQCVSNTLHGISPEALQTNSSPGSRP